MTTSGVGPHFHLLWDKVFYYSPLYTSGWLVLMLPRILLCATHLAPEALGLWTHTLVSSFPWILEMWTQVLTLGQQAVHRFPTPLPPPLSLF